VIIRSGLPMISPARSSNLRGNRFAPATLLRGGVFLLAASASAAACTVCDSESGAQVRATVFGPEFGATLLAVAAPFPVLLLLLAAYQFGWPGARFAADWQKP
jgi:hypothetical protein